MKGIARLAVGACTVVGFAAASSTTIEACGQASSHVFVGRQYDPNVKCLGDDISIDVVPGDQPPNPCPPQCVTSTFDEAGALEVYVSSMCAPFPAHPWTLVPDASTSPECQAALLAWSYDTTCEDGGKIINVPDAGSDAAGDAGGE